MPARRRQQTYRRRPQRSSPPGQGVPADGAQDATARDLAATHSEEELRSMIAAAQEVYDQSDREAQEQPGPIALRRYRLASTALRDAQRALDIASRSRAS